MYTLDQFSLKYKIELSKANLERVETVFIDKLKTLDLPGELFSTLNQVYLPLYSALIKNKLSTDRPLVLGVCGAQGSGKTTFAQLLSLVLETGFNLKVVSFSIDDFYLTLEQRLRLSERVHPLLATRGVPGTHDTHLGIDVLKKLIYRQNKVAIPQFNKAADDRHPTQKWKYCDEYPDVVIFEGWCVGARPQVAEELKTPVNDLERNEDSEISFRKYVNDCLKESYQEWFSMIDKLIFLKVPSFDKVLEWRLLQEEKLGKQVRRNFSSSKIMNRDKVKRFISFFERLTKHMLLEMPSRADAVLTIDDNHLICGAAIRKRSQL